MKTTNTTAYKSNAKKLFLSFLLMMRKKQYSLVVFFAIAIVLLNGLGNNIVAQIYFSFPTNNAVWRVDWGSASCSATFPPPYDVSNYQYQITSDTVMGLYSYHKINRTGVFYCADPLPFYLNGSGYTGAFRDDSLAKKVYYIPKDSTNESLLYDFNLSVGDTVKGYMEQLAKNQFGTTFFAIIDSVDSVLINGSYRRRWLYHTNDNWGIIWSGGEIIEGIGSNYGLLEGLLPMFDNNGYLVCHSQNGIGIYGANPCDLITSIEQLLENDDIFTIYPNPVVQGESISISSIQIDDVNLEVYDMLGKKQLITVKNNGKKLLINTSSLIEGVYLFLVKEKNQLIIQQKVTVLKRN